MKKFVCSVCGYVHEGDSAQHNVQFVKQVLTNLQNKLAK